MHAYRTVRGGGGVAQPGVNPDRARCSLPSLLPGSCFLMSNFAPCSVSAGRNLTNNPACPAPFTDEQTGAQREEVIPQSHTPVKVT